ncbi:MAG TPA: ABC transporter permease [Pirellulales bacterium]|nr:ABC transporter permease [Pirellulales bacterium]
MRFTTLVWKSILRRPFRSTLTVSGVAVAVAAVVTLVGIAHGFSGSLLKVYKQHAVDLVVVRGGVAQRMTGSLDRKLAGKIGRLENVASVTPVLFEVVSLENSDAIGVTIQGYPLDAPYFEQIKIDSGRRPQRGDQRVVLLGRVLADSLQKKVGDSLEVVEGEAFRIIGVYESYNVFENGSMIMDIDELGRLMGRQGDATFFMVTAERNDKAAIDSLRKRINGLQQGLDAMPGKEYADTASELKIARSAAWLTSTVALIVGAIGTLNTMVMSVFERVQEIGVLRAIGWRKSRVMRWIILESLLLALMGAVLGTLVGAAATRFLSTLPAAARLVSGEIEPAIIAQGFAIALGVGLLGGAYPAYRASRFLPTEALRHG